jgi:hypothetical protein
MFTEERLSNENWIKMIQLYTQRELTFQSDILPALSGIANRVRGAGKYYGGIWEKNLPSDLLWFATVGPVTSAIQLPVRPSDYIAPSFLWASIKGSVSFLNKLEDFQQIFSVKKISCEPKREDPLGELSSGVLAIEAHICRAKFVHVFERPMPADFFIKHCDPGLKCLWATLECPGIGHYIFHPDSLHLKMKSLVCVQLFASTKGSGDSCYALVLEEEGNAFKRVGIIASLEQRHFSTERSLMQIQ